MYFAQKVFGLKLLTRQESYLLYLNINFIAMEMTFPYFTGIFKNMHKAMSLYTFKMFLNNQVFFSRVFSEFSNFQNFVMLLKTFVTKKVNLIK